MPEKAYKILIVDDDQFLLDIYTTKFSQEGHDVHAVQSGEEALNELEQGDFDIVLLDVVMPSMSGLELLGNIRKRNLVPNATIIILSNQGQEEDILATKDYHIDGYIVKAKTIPSEVLEEVTSIAAKKANNVAKV
jgi:DNA-binding response OmpR family regulator